MEIEVKIRALMMDPNSGTPIIILKYVNSLSPERPAGSGANDNAFAAERAATAGIGVGSRIALVGTPFESGK